MAPMEGDAVMKGGRFRLYFRLMDICFAIQIISIMLEIVQFATGDDFTSGITGQAMAVFQLGSLALPIFLIFARFMRDDFAEQLWQLTAGTVLKAICFLPPIVAIIAGGLIAAGKIVFPEAVFDDQHVSEFQNGAIMGVIISLIGMWVYTPVVFTLAFQWHRWRATRG